jgi:SAM-dependent methyltransferase
MLGGMHPLTGAAQSAAERFLIEFHARHAGATTVALGTLPVRCAGADFDSSYHALAAHVPPDAARVLDLACGDGYLLSLLGAQRPHSHLTGIDMSAGELAAAAVRLQGRAELHEGRAQSLPFADGDFDAVTCHMALMLMEDPPAVLAELRRVLRPGATITAVVGGSSPPSRALDAYRAVLQPRLAQSNSAVPLGDRRWRAADGMQALLSAAGFGDVMQESIDGEIQLAPPALWERLMLMYDAHFLDEATHGSLRAEFLAAIAPHAGTDGRVSYPVGWRLVRAMKL